MLLFETCLCELFVLTLRPPPDTVLRFLIVFHCIERFSFVSLKYVSKQVIEKSRECHNFRPQPTSDTKKERRKA